MDITRAGNRTEKSFSAKMKKHFAQEVSTDHADILMLICCLITGFLDSTLYNAFKTFVSMQTGNTIFVALESAGQIVSSRVLGVGEVPTIVITSLLCDLLSDPLLFSPVTQNSKRNRRAIAFVLTLVGAIVGGWVSKVTKSVSPMLWVAGGCKIILTLGWGFWKGKV
ncbi:hypothetical protein NHQ30_002334 [Ciborinia camelliae]|nr:hypothetical protein NHQ30_002334 [Ciborinia camelliae]